MRKLRLICAVLMMLITGMANAHEHWGYENVSVTPMEVLPGNTIDVDFDYTIWHYAAQSEECPWEVWLDGTTDTRDGLLLDSGSNWHGGYEGETYHVDADGLAIPLTTTLGMHTIKIASAAALEEDYPGSGTYYWTVIEYTSVSIEVVPLEVDIDIKPGSCPNAFNGKAKGILPVAIVGSVDFDVADIDPTTITLAGVSPIDWSYDDTTQPIEGDAYCDICFNADDWLTDTDDDDIPDTYLGDGFQDLVLHFDTRELAAAVSGPGRDDCFEVVLTGEKLNGVPIEGSDFMIMKTKNK